MASFLATSVVAAGQLARRLVRLAAGLDRLSTFLPSQ
jgi:hypothetical protein